MRTKLTSSIMLILMGIAIMVNVGITQETSVIKLQPPQLDRGKPLMQALNERQSNRQFSAKPLDLQTLSNILWAADGVNRPESGKRTAPSAMNQQEIDIYVVMKEGIYRYDPKEHALHLIAKGDLRNLCGRQEFVAQAPVNLIYVADYRKMARLNDEERKFFSAADAGHISQNVYLFCASEGLACVVRGMVDRDALAKAMQLSPEQHIILAHTLGYPPD